MGRYLFLPPDAWALGGLAPAVVLDGEVRGKMNPPAVLETLGRWKNNDD